MSATYYFTSFCALLQSAMSCEMEPPPFIRYDDIWPTCEGTTPMLEIAIRHRLINIDLVLLHHQLAQTLHLMASLEIKGIHVFSLFDQRVVNIERRKTCSHLYLMSSLQLRENSLFLKTFIAILRSHLKQPIQLSS